MQGKEQHTGGNCPPIDLLCDDSTVVTKACEDEVPKGISFDMAGGGQLGQTPSGTTVLGTRSSGMGDGGWGAQKGSPAKMRA